MRIKEIAIDQRPRERLKSKGIDSLNDSDIVYISGTDAYLWRSTDSGKSWKNILNLGMLD